MAQKAHPGKSKKTRLPQFWGKLKISLNRFIFFLFPGMKGKHAILSAVHSIWLIALVMLWLGYVNVMDGFGFMNDHMNMRAFVNDVILNKPPPDNVSDRYLVINTSKNNALLPLDNDNTINTVITDRRLLAEKLRILDVNSDRIALVLCDVFFELPSADSQADSLLQEVIRSLSAKGKFAMPAFYNDQEKALVTPVFEGKSGLSQYRSSYLNEHLLKYSFIMYEHYKQVPLLAYENISGKSMERKKWWFIPYYTLDGRWVINTVIPEFRYVQSDFVEGLSYIHLGLFEDYFLGEGQVVVIGDIEGVYDLHQTISAFAAGPIVLINILESLRQGDNIISRGYLLLLFVVFFFCTYHIFFHHMDLPEGKTLLQRIWVFLLERWSYFLLLALVYVSMIFFHHYIHILILLSYFGLIDTLGGLLRRKREQMESPSA